jgi:hypothetical protein
MQLITAEQRLGSGQITLALPTLVPEFVEAKTLYLIGHPNRGSNLRASLVVNRSLVAPLPPLPHLPGNVIGLHIDDVYAGRFRGFVDPDHVASPILLITSDVEPAEIMLAVLGVGDPEGDAIAVAEGDTCCLNASCKYVQVTPPAAVSSYFTTPADYGAALTVKLDQMIKAGNTKAPARYFFAKLDSVTNPTLVVPSTTLTNQVSTLLNVLKTNRLITRRGLCTDCIKSCPAWPAPPLPGLTGAVTAVSQEMLKRMHDYLGNPTTSAGLTAIEKAFEEFANGELRVRIKVKKTTYWTTQPSSALYFLFAEFAFLACEAGVSAPAWENLANVLVRTQPTYCNAYKPPSATASPPFFGEYAACNYCANKPLESAHFENLRADYAGLSLDDLRRRAACNAHTYFQP